MHGLLFSLGHPSSEPGLTCATLNAGKAAKWESNACTKKLGYICRKGNATSLPPPPSKIISWYHIIIICLIFRVSLHPFIFWSLYTDKDQPSFCPSHWVPYAGNCYYLERTKKMWRDALAACHKEGGDLASILNIEEQSFIISQTGYCKCLINIFFPSDLFVFTTITHAKSNYWHRMVNTNSNCKYSDPNV